MKTNVTVSLDSELVARLDAFRAPLGCGRSHALELLLEGLPGREEPAGEPRPDLALRADGELVVIASTEVEPELVIEEAEVLEEAAPAPKKKSKHS